MLYADDSARSLEVRRWLQDDEEDDDEDYSRCSWEASAIELEHSRRAQVRSCSKGSLIYCLTAHSAHAHDTYLHSMCLA